jgi:lipoprotein-releasing system ATP-binding protein
MLKRAAVSQLLRDKPVSIQAIDLTKRYKSGDNQLTIFENLNLSVEAGERVALVGESGAGKSTLLHLLGGLDRPTRGQIFFGGREITGLGEPDMASFRNREIGFVWQTHYLLPEFTAEENVMMPLLVRGVSRAMAASPANARLDEVGLKARAHHRAGELSGGEQQRVVLARALVGNPGVLLADEPTGNLDYRTGDMIGDLFDELHRTHGLTSVFVTHNVEFAKRCDRILKLEQGSLADLRHEDTARKTARREGGTEYV